MKTDFRTYLTLEAALILKLQKAWQKEATPIYATMAQACKDHQWEKARHQVQNLDLSDVGLQNREAIKYFLRSLAIFGAEMVSKGQPSFVGVGNFDLTLNRVTQNILIYLEHDATRQVQEEALQLIAEDEAKSKVEKSEHKFGNTQVNIDPKSSATQSLDAARQKIVEKDLAGDGKDDSSQNHVTVRYGLTNDDLDDLRDFIAAQQPFEVRLGKVEFFPVSEHSGGAVPVVVRVLSPELHALHKVIEGHADFKEDSFPEYKPHATLAYVKPAAAKKYKNLYVEGSFLVRGITISHASGVQETIPFGMVRKGNPYHDSHTGEFTSKDHVSFVAAAEKNLGVLSRTAHGVSDTSVSTEKPSLTEGGTQLAEHADKNFRAALTFAWDHRNTQVSAENVEQLVLGLNRQINEGLTKPDQSRWRTWPTSYHSTPPDQIQQEMKQFYKDLSEKLNQHEDPVKTAAWTEHTFNNIHPFADGVGRTMQVLSAWTLLKNNQVLPTYQSREHFQQMNLPVAGFTEYYRTLFPVKKADPTGRFVTPFVSFDQLGNDRLELISSLNASRLATWGFTAEAEVRGVTRYKLQAVLDGRTSRFCELINGKEFDVKDARKKIEEALAVQNPADLRTVQPWPEQTNEAIAEFKEMSTDELRDRGLNVPPFHPKCRTLCHMIDQEVRTQKPVMAHVSQQIPQQTITPETLQELGVNATPEQVAHWNAYMGVSPVQMLSQLSGKTTEEVLNGDLGKKAIQFMGNGDIGVNVKGVMGGVKYAVGTVLDPYTGTYYLNDAELVTGDAEVQKEFMKHLFSTLIETGKAVAAKDLVVGVAGDVFEYAKLGFLPDSVDWQKIRANTLDELDSGSLTELFQSLSPDDQRLVTHLLQDKNEQSLGTLVDLDIYYQGKPIGEWLFRGIEGEFELDLTDPLAVDQAKAYLQ